MSQVLADRAAPARLTWAWPLPLTRRARGGRELRRRLGLATAGLVEPGMRLARRVSLPAGVAP